MKHIAVKIQHATQKLVVHRRNRADPEHTIEKDVSDQEKCPFC